MILKLREVTIIVAFAVLSLSFGFFFSTVTEGANVMAPKDTVVTESTAGEPGASSPVGVTSVGSLSTGKTSAVLGASTILPNDTLATAPSAKPSWVNMALFVDPTNEATQYVLTNPTATGAGYITRMGQTPVSEWFGDWNSDVQSDVNTYVSAAAAENAVPVLVLYNIPDRDCGGYSTGGAGSLSNYLQWTQQVVAGIASRPAVIILEPDALGDMDCLPSTADQTERYEAMSQAVTLLKASSETFVYIDAGNPDWQSTTTMAARLKAANIAGADGFSLNVSYFASTASNKTYGDQLSSLVGYKHYVIDTSRNGGTDTVSGTVCNPSYASFGPSPTTNTGSNLVDALLWIKIPWESDGPCNGAPNPGVVYWSYAIQLAENSGW
jgi:endoglucanase